MYVGFLCEKLDLSSLHNSNDNILYNASKCIMLILNSKEEVGKL